MNDEIVLVVSDGRKLGIREVDAGDMLDIIEAAGNAVASDSWLQYALTICAVRSIDGVPVRLPTSKDGIRDLARRIGSPALDEVAEHLSSTRTSGFEQTAKN